MNEEVVEQEESIKAKKGELKVTKDIVFIGYKYGKELIVGERYPTISINDDNLNIYQESSSTMADNVNIITDEFYDIESQNISDKVEISTDIGFADSINLTKDDLGFNEVKLYVGGFEIGNDYTDDQLEAALSGNFVFTKEPVFIDYKYGKVRLPKKLSNDSFTKEIWQEYGARCIACGRCNFVCPTCTCFTMQDIFYKDNPKAGERRRVWASCQIDGYTEMAGGHGFRKSQGDRMRFKVMHKIYDFEKRFGYTMCVGCGRCDDVCPEYISYSNCINRLAKEEDE